MHTFLTRPVLGLVFTVLLAGISFAQVPQVQVSQAAMVKQTVGLADITVTYHRPGVKGRTIWGGLLKYGEIWRAGANQPTLITFSEDVAVGGTPLKAGTYRLVVMPMEKGPWSVIFNSEVKNWGSTYEKRYDVATVKVDPSDVPHKEWMSFSIENLIGDSPSLVLHWEKKALHIPLAFDTKGLFAAKIGTIEGNVVQVKNNYARYLLSYGTNMEAALAAANEAVALNKSASTLRTKAEILGKMERFDEAISTMQDAIRAGKARNPDMNTSFYEGFITRWKDM